MVRIALLVLTVLFGDLPSPASARVWNVLPDGTGDAPTIAAAIDSSAAPDTIALHTGTYLESELYLKAGTTLLGVGGLPGGAVLSGEAESTILWVSEGDSLTTTTIRGLAFTTADDGVHQDAGVVHVENCRFDVEWIGVRNHRGHSLVVRDSSFRGGLGGVVGSAPVYVYDCTMEEAPYAVSVFDASCVIHRTVMEATYYAVQISNAAVGELLDCTVRDAQVGLAVEFGEVTVRGCLFEGNGETFTPRPPELRTLLPRCGLPRRNAGRTRPRFPQRDRLASRGLYYLWDGAAYVYPGGAATFEDCEFRDNRSTFGGAIESWGDLTLEACRFIGNAALDSGGALFFGRYQSPPSGTGTNCTFTGGSAPHGSAVAMGWGSVHFDRSIFAFEESDQPFAGPASAYATCSNLYANGTGIPDGRTHDLLDDGTNFSADPWFCGTDDLSIAALSLCAPDLSPCGTLIGAGPVACYPEGAYVDTQPPGLFVLGDGVSRAAAAVFEWSPGEIHQVSAPDTQVSVLGQAYVFSEWDDGGAQTHDVTVPGPGIIATARYLGIYRLTMEADPGGSVTPETGDWVEGTVVPIQAIADPGHVFVTWWSNGAGGYNGPEPAYDLEIADHVTQHAVFAPAVPVTITGVPPGRTVLVNGLPHVTPATVDFPVSTWTEVDANAPQMVAPGSRYAFVSWSDGGDAAHSIAVTQPTELTVVYELEHELTMDEHPHATVLPGNGWHDAGTVVPIEAIPDYEWVFAAWVGAGNGAYSGSDNPALVTMNGPIHQVPLIESAFDGHGYEFTISASSTDPLVHESPTAGDVRYLYLWGTCLQRGLAAFEAQVTGSLPVLGFDPAPMVLNVGTATHLQLAVGGCPTGSSVDRLLGTWIVLDLEGGTLCLESPDGGQIATADCSPVVPQIWPDPHVRGFSSDGSAPCDLGTNGCLENPTPVFLSGLEASAAEGQVLIRWRTAFESRHDGFHVYRSTYLEGPYERLTERLVRGTSPYAYRDDRVLPVTDYYYEIGAVDLAGREVRYGPVIATTPAWGMPTALDLARPSPFGGETMLRFTLAEPTRTTLSVYDITGRRVRTLVRGELGAGSHGIVWDCSDDDGLRVGGGTYFVKLSAGDVAQTRKVVYLGGR